MARLAVAAISLAVAVVSFAALPAFAATGPTAYTNHTVGGTAGWFFDDTTNSSATDYTAWAATQSFYLGDYLIFNSNTNMTVVVTDNATTYSLCNVDEDYGNNTLIYSDSQNMGLGLPATLALQLTMEGPNYFFSDAGPNNVQCHNGLQFKIFVGQALGLPTPSPSAEPPVVDTTPPAEVTPPATTVSPTAYMNHTVGGTAGWFFDYTTNSSATNYTAWAATQSFYLGDYLIFNSNTNMTLVVTDNATTYSLCNPNEDNGNNTLIYYDYQNMGLGLPVRMALQLTMKGPNYFFSDAGPNNVQCHNGLQFKILVGEGLGRPTTSPSAGPPAADKTPPAADTTTPAAGTTTPPATTVSPDGKAKGLFTNDGAVGGPEMGLLGLVLSGVLGVVIGYLA